MGDGRWEIGRWIKWMWMKRRLMVLDTSCYNIIFVVILNIYLFAEVLPNGAFLPNVSNAIGVHGVSEISVSTSVGQ